MLFSIPAFINSLDGKGNKLTMSILKVYNEINNSIGVSVDPRSIKDAIDSLGTNFSRPRKQHDAHEFLIYLLNSVHNELIAERNESMTNEVDEYFRIHVKYSLKCTTCEATR
jgi:ubiquitin C-terminal hydrolase